MTEAIIVAIIAAISSIIGQWLIGKRNTEKESIERAKQQQKLDDRLALLTSRVDEHNNYAKMFQEATKNINDISTEIKLLSQDVKYLKDGKFK